MKTKKPAPPSLFDELASMPGAPTRRPPKNPRPSTAAVRQALIKVIKAYGAAFGDGTIVKGNKVTINGMSFTVDVDKDRGLGADDCTVKVTMATTVGRMNAVKTAERVSTMVGAMVRVT